MAEPIRFFMDEHHPHPVSQALRRGRTTTYGLVIRNFSNPFFLEVLTGAERAASEAGADCRAAGDSARGAGAAG